MRAAWRAEVSGKLAASRFVFVDEMGTNISLPPLYGWSRVGERLRVKVPKNWGKNVTLLSSMSTEGMGPSVAIEGATTGVVFEAYVEQALVPSLSPDLNPIEEAFSKVKGILRKAQARTRETLIETMGWALCAAVGPSDARGFFEHRGYRAATDQPF